MEKYGIFTRVKTGFPIGNVGKIVIYGCLWLIYPSKLVIVHDLPWKIAMIDMIGRRKTMGITMDVHGKTMGDSRKSGW